SKPVACHPCGNGNINSTFWVKTEDGQEYLVQRVNTYVFKKPYELMENIQKVTHFLADKISEKGGDFERGTLNFIQSDNGRFCYHDHETDAFWRIYHYVSGAVAYDSADKSGVLREAARAFGKFQRHLEDYPAETLHETIPNFHHTLKRYEAFEASVAADAAGRAASVAKEIEALRRYAPYASMIVDGLSDGTIPTRVTHNDTKLNNVLFDEQSGKCLCVIDLDTVMPGSLLCDFGDAIRFAANNTAEDDPDLSKVFLRLDLFEEYVSGFFAGLKGAITEQEIALLPESAMIMTYELALRFMTDYLDGDKYFKLKYPEHNLVRTRAQIHLCEDIEIKIPEMRKIIEKYAK
ncbi:MAG: aminoglycoside phosphotransferase family protein, partial [Clostridia bacterium]|nr:aminoglycoside phosphotransferase family protein [Clostridia bacterium]